MSLLTLVMIVRDEAAGLPAFFTHHAGLWDEAIVVDTGSTDATSATAAQAGARVIHETWSDDFAAARNVGLAAAGGQRILLLDADERIARRDFAAVRAAAMAPPCAWLQSARNYCVDRTHLEWRPTRGEYPTEEGQYGGYFVSRRVGLFPADAAIRFRGRIHESVLDDCELAGLPVHELPVPVHHYGYVGGAAVTARRHELYERLAARKLADDPGDWSALLEYAVALLEAGRIAEASTRLEKLVGGPGRLRAVARGRFLLARLRREQNRPAEARALLDEATRDDPEFLFGWLERIRQLAAGERWREVHDVLVAARAAAGADEPLLDREELLALIRTGQLTEALALARRLADTCPGWPEIADLRTRLERLVGQGPGAS